MSLPKVLLVLVVFSSLFFTISPSAHAQTAQYITPNIDANVPQDQHTYVQSMVIEIFAAGICQLTGTDVLSNKPCLSVNPQTNKIGYAPPSSQPGGLIGLLTTSMGGMYNIPIHSSSYVHYMASNFGLTTPAYAQNTGFNQLDYMLRFWRLFRDIAYMGFVLAFVLIGMAIMLRVKIDPRTVMTIQNQLPKIIITMLLITFSYSIASFLVDIMWVSTYVVINLTDQVGNAGGKNDIDTPAIIKNLVTSPYNFYGTLTGNLGQDMGGDNGVSKVAAQLPGPVNLARRVGETFGDVTGALSPTKNPGECGLTNIPNCGGALLNGILQWLSTTIIFFIVIVAILITLARIWIMLLRAFINVIMYTAFAPIYLFAGIFPGSTLGFDPWIRALLSNLAVFPACVGLLVMSRLFMTGDNGVTLGFAPPMIGTPTDGAQGIGYVIGFGMLLITPNVLTIVREALKSNPSKHLSPAIESGFKAGASTAAAIPSKIYGKTFEKSSTGEVKSAIGRYLVYGKGGLTHQVGALPGKVRGLLRFGTGTSAHSHHAVQQGDQDAADRAKELARQRQANADARAAGNPLPYPNVS